MSRTLLPTDLSPEAQALYHLATISNGGLGAHRYWEEWEARTIKLKHKIEVEALTPKLAPEDFEFAREIDAAGLGVFHLEESKYATLQVYRLHPLFTQAVGLNLDYTAWDVEVVLVDGEAPGIDEYHRVLFRGEGAGFHPQDRSTGPERWRLSVRHPSATDFEHDSCYLADFELAGVQVTHYGSCSVEHYGVIMSASLYPNGQGPEPDEESHGTCTYEHCPAPHQLAAFTPPKVVDLKGRLVKFVLRSPQES